MKGVMRQTDAAGNPASLISSKAMAALLTGLVCSLSQAGCDRHPPIALNPPAAEASVALPGRWVNPADIVIGYNTQVGDIAHGHAAEYKVAVSNHGSQALKAAGPYAPFVTYQWLNGEGGRVTATAAITPLTGDLLPGQTVLVGFRVVAPEATGAYILKVSMGFTGGSNFEPGGQAPLHYKVTVN